jgi:hypothetical protein
MKITILNLGSHLNWMDVIYVFMILTAPNLDVYSIPLCKNNEIRMNFYAKQQNDYINK